MKMKNHGCRAILPCRQPWFADCYINSKAAGWLLAWWHYCPFAGWWACVFRLCFLCFITARSEHNIAADNNQAKYEPFFHGRFLNIPRIMARKQLRR
jgi:hypothetical protein